MSIKLILFQIKKIIPQSKIENKLNINNNNFPFFEKLNHQNSQISIIGEIKKASPSLGKFTKENINLIILQKHMKIIIFHASQF